MTYKEKYNQCDTIDELKKMATEDVRVALVLGANTDRLKAIENAMNERAEEIERGEKSVWTEADIDSAADAIYSLFNKN